MPFLSKIISFWKNLFHRRQVEHDLNSSVIELRAENLSPGKLASR